MKAEEKARECHHCKESERGDIVSSRVIGILLQVGREGGA